MEKNEKTADEVVMPTGSSISEGDLQTVTFGPEEEKRVTRRIDRVVLPLMCTVYFFQCKCIQ
jgi:hypothetical protein